MPLHPFRAAIRVGALCGVIALAMPAVAQSVVKQHQLTSGTSICCSGGISYYHSPRVDSDGTMYTPIGWSWADFRSTAAPGSFSGSIRLQAQTVCGVHARFLGGQICNGSTDTLFATSGTLPVGTPLTLRFELRGSGGWGAGGRSQLNVGGVAQADAGAGYPGERVLTVERSDPLSVGGSWTFDTQYRVFGDGYADTNVVIDGAGWDSIVDGHASLTIEILEPGALMTSASGHNCAPIPEPAGWALMLVGLALVGHCRPRLHPVDPKRNTP